MAGSNHLSSLTDLQLIVALCTEQTDEEIFAEFVKRFLLDLKKECLKICDHRNLDHHLGIQIAHDSFEKARKYKSFKEDSINASNSRKGILVYLIRIARNLFNDHYRTEKKKQEVIVNKTYFDGLFEKDDSAIEPVELARKKDRALEVYHALSQKEQKVIATDLLYKGSVKYLPDDINDQLAAELGVKKSSIRKIRERAIKKLKTAVDGYE